MAVTNIMAVAVIIAVTDIPAVNNIISVTSRQQRTPHKTNGKTFLVKMFNILGYPSFRRLTFRRMTFCRRTFRRITFRHNGHFVVAENTP